MKVSSPILLFASYANWENLVLGGGGGNYIQIICHLLDIVKIGYLWLIEKLWVLCRTARD